MKEILRIAIFSLGGLLAAIGILMLAGVFISMRGHGEEFVGGAAMATLLLIAGVGVCALAPRMPRLPADLRTMSQEEKAIFHLRNGMKQHRLRVGLFATFVVVMSSGLVFTLWQTRKLDARVTPEYFRVARSLDDPNEISPALLFTVYTLAGAKTKLLYHTYWFAAWTGVFVGLFVMELAGRTKPQLTLAMWERIQRLESEIKDLRKREGRGDC